MESPQQKKVFSKKGNGFLSFVPQICAILVVILHQFNVHNCGTVSKIIIGFISHGIATAAVPTFFCISGFLFWTSAMSYKAVHNKLVRRIKTVLVPFLLWNCFYATVYTFLNNGWTSISISGIISSVILYEYYFPMWYMFQLMVFFLISPILYLMLKRKTVIISFIIVLALFTVFVTSDISFSYNGLERSLIQFNYLIYYVIGGLLSRCNFKLSSVRLPNLYVCVALFGGTCLLSSLFMDNWLCIGYRRLFVPLVFMTFTCMMIKIIQIKKPKFNILCGASPMVIYGIHGFAGMVLSALFIYLGWGNSLFRYSVLCVLCVALSILMSIAFKKFLPQVYSLFAGNR